MHGNSSLLNIHHVPFQLSRPTQPQAPLLYPPEAAPSQHRHKWVQVLLLLAS